MPSSTNNFLTVIQGIVEVSSRGNVDWVLAKLNKPLYAGDRVRTGERSRAEVYLATGMTIQKAELSEIEIPPSEGITFKKGLFKVFNREKTTGTKFKLPGATAAIRGTDFLVVIPPVGFTRRC